MSHPWRLAFAACGGATLGLSLAPGAIAQARLPPSPSGRQVQAADGDTVVVEGDDRVSLVRRRQAHVRVVADEAARTVIVIADWGTRDSAQPDGRVNRTWRFEGVDGRWPLDSRWDGDAVLMVPEKPPMSAGPSLSLETPAGVVAFVGGGPYAPGVDAAAVLRHEGLSSGGREGVTFDEAEREALSPNFMASFRSMSIGPAGGYGVAGVGANAVFEAAVPPPDAGTPARGPIVRAMPRIVERVPPVWPPDARDANITGAVIIQADVSADGSVRDARVLRGVPLLDAAAVEAVRHWRFEPAGASGRPDPVTVTVVVQFPPQP